MRHAFSTYSNWIVPGYLMLGRYPFVEPRRCESHEQGQQQLQQILDAGITTFVCLQAELPRQEGMPLQGIDGFSPYLETALRLHSGELCYHGLLCVHGQSKCDVPKAVEV
jgi:hypothetical protein